MCRWKKRLRGKACGRGGVFLNEFQRDRTRAEKLFDRPRMRFGRVRREDGLLQREKFLTGAHDESVMRHRNDIRRFATGQAELTNPPSARTGEGGIVRNERIRRGVGKTNRDRDVSASKMSGLGQICRHWRWGQRFPGRQFLWRARDGGRAAGRAFGP